MKKLIKVAIMTIRTMELEPAPAVTVDNDIPPAYGTAKMSHRAFFSEGLGDDAEKAFHALGPILNKVSRSMVKIGPEEPWVDTTSRIEFFSEPLSAEAVKLLADALPQYAFEVAENPYEVYTLTRKCYRLNMLPSKVLTISEKPNRSILSKIAKKMTEMGYSSLPADLSASDRVAWCDKLARDLTTEKEKIAFAAAPDPQPFELRYELRVPLLGRLIGATTPKPRLLVALGATPKK